MFSRSLRVLLGVSIVLCLAAAGSQGEKIKEKELARSAALPVIVDIQALLAKVQEAKKTIQRLDQETLRARSQTPGAQGAFASIHAALTSKPAQAGDYGGGMLARLESIESDLSKSRDALARAPSVCKARDASERRFAAAGLQLLKKTLTRVLQAKNQALWTNRAADKLLRDAGRRLRTTKAKDEAVLRLSAYQTSLKKGLASTADDLGRALDSKSFGKKSLQVLGAECGAELKLLSAGAAGSVLAGGAGAGTQAADIRPAAQDKAAPAGDSGDCSSAVGTLSCERDYAVDIKDKTALAAQWQKALDWDKVQCPSINDPAYCQREAEKHSQARECALQMLKGYQGLQTQAKERCNKKCPDGSMTDSGGNCRCGGAGYDPGTACCGKGVLYPGKVPTPDGDCASLCGKEIYDDAKACCSAGVLYPGLTPVAGGKCGCPEGKTLSAQGACIGGKYDAEISKECGFKNSMNDATIHLYVQCISEKGCSAKGELTDSEQKAYSDCMIDYARAEPEKRPSWFKRAIMENVFGRLTYPSWEKKWEEGKEAHVSCNGEGKWKYKLEQWQGAPCGIEYCSKRHEETHVIDYSRDFPGSCIGINDDGIPPIFNTAERERLGILSQCRAFDVGIECMKRKLSVGPSAFCEERISFFLSDVIGRKNAFENKFGKCE